MDELMIKESEDLTRQDRAEVLFERFKAFLELEDPKDKTVATYKRALRQMFSYFAENDIRQPEREDILSYRQALKDRGLKPSSIQNYITAARIFFRWTAQEGIYPNIADHVKGAKLNREHKKDYLTPSQIKAILNRVDRGSLQGLRDYAILCLMVTCGLRTIEVVNANKEDLRPLGDDTALYILGKGREEKAEYVKVPPKTEQAIRDYLSARGKISGEDPLFASLSNNSKGSRMTTRSISGICKAAMQESGFDSDRLTAHSLRHSAVTISLLSGQTLEEVQQFARHKRLDTTLIYSHALDQAKNKCSNAIAGAIF